MVGSPDAKSPGGSPGLGASPLGTTSVGGSIFSPVAKSLEGCSVASADGSEVASLDAEGSSESGGADTDSVGA